MIVRDSEQTAGYVEEIWSRGYAVIRDVLTAGAADQLLKDLSRVEVSDAVRRRGLGSFGIRDLLNVVPAVRELAVAPAIRSIVEPVVGRDAAVVRAIFFDKVPDANWNVSWHQDLTIAVRERKSVEGFRGWSRKAGVIHVQPPSSILESILAVRLHLDDADETNGALRVVPGSHRRGRLCADTVRTLTGSSAIVETCPVSRGGAMLMRPLLLHASTAAQQPSHRRVVHLEFSAAVLPGGLEWHGS